jgi:hypothetical protein
MIGFFIADKKIVTTSTIENSIGKLKTISEYKTFETEKVCVYLLFNHQSNNYFINDEDYIIISTGAVVYKNRIRNESLRLILRNLIQNTFKYSDLSGHFNLMILNTKNHDLSLFTDREGLQSGYYFKKNDAYILSSNLLLLASQISYTLSKKAAVDFIHIGNSLSGQTLFNEINKIPPAVSFKIKNGKWEERREWKISVNYPYAENKSKAIINNIHNLLIKSIDFCKHIPPNEIAADLTGGTDTRTIVSFLCNYILPLNVFTAGPPSHIDVKIAKLISHKLQFKLRWLQPFPDNADLNLVNEAIEYADGSSDVFQTLYALRYLTAKANYFKIVFGGNGGPLFKDHYWLFEFNRINRMREPNWSRIARLSVLSSSIQNDIFIDEFKVDIIKKLESLFIEVSKEIQGTNNQKMDYVYFSRKCVDFMGPQFTLSNNFFDIFHPMLYGEIVENIINSHPQIRKNGNLQFNMIYNNNRKLSWIKTDNIYPAVPTNGIFFFLKLLILFRYFKAILRKFSEVVLKRRGTKPLQNEIIDLFYLQETKLINYLNYDTMKLKEIINRNVLIEYIKNINRGSNLHYIKNILSIELFLNKIDNISS